MKAPLERSARRRSRYSTLRNTPSLTTCGVPSAIWVRGPIVTEGRSRIDDQTFEWGARDLFVVPSWHWVTHEADTDAVLFSFSDRPVQQKLDLFREDRGNA